MSTRKHSPLDRAFRPLADDLETRQMLSTVVSGLDSKGDAWTLRLIGPGSLSVVKQNAAGTTNPAALGSRTDINTITVGGTDPLRSRLVGTVTATGAGSDGRVFFQRLTSLPTRSEQNPTLGLGLLAVNAPGFWLGNTTPAAVAATATAPAIDLPDGVDTLYFGGVDTTFNLAPATSTTTSSTDTVQLGLPYSGGTRIIIDRSISSSQSVPARTAGGTATTAQHGVTFAVSGRLQLFQANSIVGDRGTPPGQFANENSAATGAGGTIVLSSTPGGSATSTFFNDAQIKGGVTGAIGNVRVGGDATNFSTYVFDPAFGGSDRIGNFSVGGETTNVLLVAPSGARNVVFGRGMDTVEIRAHVINTLMANRGALNSNVAVDRAITREDFGGDVNNTRVLTGYQQNYASIFSTVTGLSTSILSSSSPAPPPIPTSAQVGGGQSVHVAGDVTNSVFASSVVPFNGRFGDPNQLVLPGGYVKGKVEGTINNAIATPGTPNQAFFAQQVSTLAGPVVPPNVPSAPYRGRQLPRHLPGVNAGTIPYMATRIPFSSIQDYSVHTQSPARPAAQGETAAHAAALKAAAAAEATAKAATPKGPLALKTTLARG